MPHDPGGIAICCLAVSVVLYLLYRKRKAARWRADDFQLSPDLVDAGHTKQEEQWRSHMDESVFRERINRLVKEKQRRGYTVRSMCREIGVNPSTLSEWRRGKAFPTRKNMERVARYFGVSVQWLCSEDAEKKYHDLLDETKNKA